MTVNRWLTIVALTLGALAGVLGDGPVPPGGPAEISALVVASTLRTIPDGIHIADIRSQEAFDNFHLPRATHLPVDQDPENPSRLGEWLRGFDGLAIQPGDQIVIGGGPETPTRELWSEVRKAGYRASYMPDMVGDWVDVIVSPVRGPTEDPEKLRQWAEITDLSRYFGGFPRVVETLETDLANADSRLQRARRRGCAF